MQCPCINSLRCCYKMYLPLYHLGLNMHICHAHTGVMGTFAECKQGFWSLRCYYSSLNLKEWGSFWNIIKCEQISFTFRNMGAWTVIYHVCWILYFRKQNRVYKLLLQGFDEVKSWLVLNFRHALWYNSVKMRKILEISNKKGL